MDGACTGGSETDRDCLCEEFEFGESDIAQVAKYTGATNESRIERPQESFKSQGSGPPDTARPRRFVEHHHRLQWRRRAGNRPRPEIKWKISD